MIRFLTKIYFFIIPLFLSLEYVDAQTQQRVITSLNKHFFQVNPRDSSNHIYNQIFSPVTKSTKIYTKSNRLVKSIEDDINPEGDLTSVPLNDMTA